MNRCLLRLPVLASMIAACGRSDVRKQPDELTPESSRPPVEIDGAGAAAPSSLYSKWSLDYQNAHPSSEIHYRAIGSREGIRQILDRAVDFGATDMPMTEADLSEASEKLVQLPITVGAVAVVYNLPIIPPLRQLKLSREVLAAIYLGEIKTWNDPRIAALNPGPKLPGAGINVAYRSDGGGTTAVFTQYLWHISNEWREKVGTSKSVRFPVGVGAEGNEGITARVRNNPGTLGYVELGYAKRMGLTAAALQNRAGRFIEPSVDSITATAASNTATASDLLRMSLVNASGEMAYPICAFSYVLVYEEQPSITKGRSLAHALWWAVHEGQNVGAAVDYGPLPQQVVAKVERELKGLRSKGQPLLSGS